MDGMTGQSEQLVDEILVMDCQSGSSKALDLLVSRWQKRLWHYACRLTGNSEAAWEVTQESWLGIIRGIRRLNDPARFRAWAYRIVTNKSRDWIKRKATRTTPQTDEPIDRPQHDGPPANETSADLQTILGRLSERNRTVLTLHYLEEIGVAEIAKILRVPKGTVKSRLHTARAEFKRLWQAMDEGAQTDASVAQKGEPK
jgi:RNA polymerase sigma-70 factor (ECF subfamily)